MMSMRSRLVLLLFIAFTSPLAPSRLLAEPAPGVVLTFESLDGKQNDAREARLIALCVPENSPPTPFITPGPFRAIFRGSINLRIRDQYTFCASGRGEFELLLNGESVLKSSGDDLSTKTSEPVKLKKGANEMIVRYAAPAKGDAIIRLSWAEQN